MLARGPNKISCALLTLALFTLSTTLAFAWDQHYRYPLKVRVSEVGLSKPGMSLADSSCGQGPNDWEYAAGASRRQILCPRKTYDFGLGARPFFSNISGVVKATSKGGEGTLANLHGHLRIPGENTLWELYARLRMWEKVAIQLDYLPWTWSGAGHAGIDGNFAGVLYKLNEAIESNLNITTFKLGADYDVSYNEDLFFGPNADFHIIRWNQSLSNSSGQATEFSQTILQPAIGGHVRYEPSNTGYFSWFKPYFEGRLSWMSFAGLGMGTWDLSAGIAPPLSENVDAGFRIGYKQWKLEGTRGRLLTDVAVEGLFFDFSLRF